MIAGGNATLIVADLDRSIRFYTEVLDLKLTSHFGNNWATVSAGDGFTIGIHPASEDYPPPGTQGAMVLGLDIDIPIDTAVARLLERGIQVHGAPVRTGQGNFVRLEDPDGTRIYLWEKAGQVA